MTNHGTDWHKALAAVTGVLVRGEQRVTTDELLTLRLGVPITDQACRRLRRVMRELGWKGPRRMRWGKRTTNGYWRHPTVGPPAILQQEPVAEAATVEPGTLAIALEAVTHLGLQKIGQILRLPTDVNNGNVLRAQTVAAATAVNAQLRADENQLKHLQRGDKLDRLLKIMKLEQEKLDEIERRKLNQHGHDPLS